ncbi:MAG TPA: flavodoxin domain-containing protein [Ilumatobacteraceae bacterium]|jgi:hypothetical protein
MRAFVVYESLYGNTRQIAEAVADGLRFSVDAETALAGDVRAASVEGFDLVVVGAPTHAWSLSRRRTREAAAVEVEKRAGHVTTAAVDVGVREWMRSVRVGPLCRGVAFDTRLDQPRFITGSAVRAIERGLLAAGFSIFARANSFKVTGQTGPLATGELERARLWGEALGRALVQSGVTSSKAA